MSFDDPTSDTVLFAIVDPAEAALLSGYLRSTRQEALHDCNGIWVVAVELEPREGDLATLLRDVEAWVARRPLRELRFSLDGCWYVLRAGAVETQSAA
jgi:hypothetical protein